MGELYPEGYCVVDLQATKKWYKNGELHRDNDKPAIIWSNGQKEWYKNGKRHRDGDKPAVINPDDNIEIYYSNNILTNIQISN